MRLILREQAYCAERIVRYARREKRGPGKTCTFTRRGFPGTVWRGRRCVSFGRLKNEGRFPPTPERPGKVGSLAAVEPSYRVPTRIVFHSRHVRFPIGSVGQREPPRRCGHGRTMTTTNKWETEMNEFSNGPSPNALHNA